MAQMATVKSNELAKSRLATCYTVINGKRYSVMNAKKLEYKINIETQEFGVLGTLIDQAGQTKVKITGKLSQFDNDPIFHDLAIKYATKGEQTFFDIYATNEDPTSVGNIGRRTVILKDCVFKGVNTVAFDVEGKYLEKEIEFIAGGIEYPEQFKLSDKMEG